MTKETLSAYNARLKEALVPKFVEEPADVLCDFCQTEMRLLARPPVKSANDGLFRREVRCPECSRTGTKIV